MRSCSPGQQTGVYFYLYMLSCFIFNNRRINGLNRNIEKHIICFIFCVNFEALRLPFGCESINALLLVRHQRERSRFGTSDKIEIEQ